MSPRNRQSSFFRSLLLVLVTLTQAPFVVAHTASQATSPDNCYAVADYGDYPNHDDLLTHITVTRGSSSYTETTVGFTGTLNIEDLASDPNDPSFTIWGVDGNRLGKLDKSTGHFTAVSASTFGSGNGSLGAMTFNDSDGVAFDPSTTPSTMYAVIRKDTPAQDLLIKVDPATGMHVADAFGPGQDYVPIQAFMSLDDVDDLVFRDAVLLGIINKNGIGSRLVKINKASGSVTDVGPTNQNGGPGDVEGLTRSISGLYGVNEDSTTRASSVWDIDEATGATTNPRRLGLDNGARDYEGMTCFQPRSAKITIRKFNDLNLNGSRDSGEPGLAGWHMHVINATTGDDVHADTQASSDAEQNGTVTVTLPAGHYHVCETLQRGWLQTAPTSGIDCTAHTADAGQWGFDVTVAPDDTKLVEFGNAQPPRLTIRKFNDLNANGTRDADEPGLSGWQIHIINATSGADTHVVTEPNPDPNVNGTVSVALPAGHYFFCETQQTGWTQTAPASGFNCSSHSASAGPRGFDITLPGDSTAIEFGNAQVCTGTPQKPSARAFGLRADLLGGGLLPATPDIGPTPDSDVTNPDQLFKIDNPLDATHAPLVTLLGVSESDNSTSTVSSSTATAKTAAVDVFVPALQNFEITADAIVARSSSSASKDGGTSSSAGSTILNLKIGGVQYGDVSEPTTVVINDPTTGQPFVEVHILERIGSGAAAGVSQPHPRPPVVPSTISSGLAVNAIHVVVHDLVTTTPLDESTDIIVAHAESSASFKVTANPDKCPGPISGRAFAAQLFNMKPDLANAIIGEVILPSGGGSEAAHVVDANLVVGTADAASATTDGTTSAGPPASASSNARARVAHLDLLSGTVKATLVQAESHSDLAATSGSTTLVALNIGGTDVCMTLGLTDTCTPKPNTPIFDGGPVLILLNEQITDASDPKNLTVNAIHIFILGKDNPFNLPVGAEIIISSAHTDAHRATHG